MALREAFVNALCNLNVIPSPTAQTPWEEIAQTQHEGFKRKRKRHTTKPRQHNHDHDYARITLSDGRGTRKPRHTTETTHIVDVKLNQPTLARPIAQKRTRDIASNTVSRHLLPPKRTAFSGCGCCFQTFTAQSCPFSKSHPPAGETRESGKESGPLLPPNFNSCNREVGSRDGPFSMSAPPVKKQNTYTDSSESGLIVKFSKLSPSIKNAKKSDVVLNTESSLLLPPNVSGGTQEVGNQDSPLKVPASQLFSHTAVSGSGNVMKPPSSLSTKKFNGCAQEVGGQIKVSAPQLFSNTTLSRSGPIVKSSSCCSSETREVTKLELPWREVINRGYGYWETSGLPLFTAAVLYSQLFVYTKLIGKLIIAGAPTPPQSPTKWMANLAVQPCLFSQSTSTVAPGKSFTHLSTPDQTKPFARNSRQSFVRIPEQLVKSSVGDQGNSFTPTTTPAIRRAVEARSTKSFVRMPGHLIKSSAGEQGKSFVQSFDDKQHLACPPFIINQGQSSNTDSQKASTSCPRQPARLPRCQPASSQVTGTPTRLAEGQRSGPVLLNPSQDERSVAETLLELCRSHPCSRS